MAARGARAADVTTTELVRRSLSGRGLDLRSLAFEGVLTVMLLLALGVLVWLLGVIAVRGLPVLFERAFEDNPAYTVRVWAQIHAPVATSGVHAAALAARFGVALVSAVPHEPAVGGALGPAVGDALEPCVPSRRGRVRRSSVPRASGIRHPAAVT